MDEIEDRWNKLRLTKEEEVVIELPQGGEEEIQCKGDRSLIGKICSDRAISKEVIANAMGKIWRISKRAVFQEVEKNVFVITFANHADRQRILDGKPWLFASMLFMILPYDGDLQPRNMHVDKETFWLQVHNLPLGFMTEEWGHRIEASVGEVLDVDVDEDGIGWGKCLRVRVEIKLQKAIARGRTIMANGKKVWLSFKYEKLPKICFSCGWILHGENGCMNEEEGNQGSSSQFGSWLRAEDSYKRRPILIPSNANSNGREEGQRDPVKEAGGIKAEGSMGSTASRRQAEGLALNQNRVWSGGSENHGIGGGTVTVDKRRKILAGEGEKTSTEDEIDGTQYEAMQSVGMSLHCEGNMHGDEDHTGQETSDALMGLNTKGLAKVALEKSKTKNGPNKQTQEKKQDEGEGPTKERDVSKSQLLATNQTEGVATYNQGSCRWKRHARGQGSTPTEGGLRPGTKRPAETNEEDQVAPARKRRGKTVCYKSDGNVTSKAVEFSDQPHRRP
ncbi:uncharacterized protein LOC122310195 [Carya illinoinensis]|uniref:uncharacterized protein LOC122310195 n=1 Tax=Carya illinoinensis TaxID=32201 RepID=UPI001C72277B|nr:uncharacterized protein LOC122310195 [Carya illinoinensis]